MDITLRQDWSATIYKISSHKLFFAVALSVVPSRTAPTKKTYSTLGNGCRAQTQSAALPTLPQLQLQLLYRQ